MQNSHLVVHVAFEVSYHPAQERQSENKLTNCPGTGHSFLDWTKIENFLFSDHDLNWNALNERILFFGIKPNLSFFDIELSRFAMQTEIILKNYCSFRNNSVCIKTNMSRMENWKQKIFERI